MANAKISQLPAAGAITGAELVPVVQGGVTSQTTVDDILTGTTLTTVDLGTPTAGVLTNCTGLPVSTGVDGLGAGVATFLGTPSSANLRGAVTDETGTGALVFATSPTLVTPTLGVAAATSVNKVAITAPATASTLTIADGKTLTANSTLTLAGVDSKTLTINNTMTLTATDSSTVAFGGGGTVAYQASAAAADFNAAANAINTTGKYAGKMAWSTDDLVPVWAAGATAGAVWVLADGTTKYTPA